MANAVRVALLPGQNVHEIVSAVTKPTIFSLAEGTYFGPIIIACAVDVVLQAAPGEVVFVGESDRYPTITVDAKHPEGNKVKLLGLRIESRGIAPALLHLHGELEAIGVTFLSGVATVCPATIDIRAPFVLHDSIVRAKRLTTAASPCCGVVVRGTYAAAPLAVQCANVVMQADSVSMLVDGWSIVRLQGVTIEGPGRCGVVAGGRSEVSARDCHFSTAIGITAERSSRIFVHDCLFDGNGAACLVATDSSRGTMVHCQLRQVTSPCQVAASGNSTVAIRNSDFFVPAILLPSQAFCTACGVVVGDVADAVVEGSSFSLASGTAAGIVVDGSSTARIHHNVFRSESPRAAGAILGPWQSAELCENTFEGIDDQRTITSLDNGGDADHLRIEWTAITSEPPSGRPDVVRPAPPPLARPDSARARAVKTTALARPSSATTRLSDSSKSPIGACERVVTVGGYVWNAARMKDFLQLKATLHEVRCPVNNSPRSEKATSQEIAHRLHDEWLKRKEEKALENKAREEMAKGWQVKLSDETQSASVKRLYDNSVTKAKATATSLEARYYPKPPSRKLSHSELSEFNNRMFTTHEKYRKDLGNKLWQKYVVAEDKRPHRRQSVAIIQTYCASLHKGHRDPSLREHAATVTKEPLLLLAARQSRRSSEPPPPAAIRLPRASIEKYCASLYKSHQDVALAEAVAAECGTATCLRVARRSQSPRSRVL